jgi:hypothetical protein
LVDRRDHDAAIVEQNVELGLFLGEFRGSAFDGREVRQIHEEEVSFLASLRFQVVDRGLGFLFTARRDVYLGVVLKEGFGCLLSYTYSLC